ncbi:MAG: peroxide stress protein YaaA [Saprospiraceae bacterium]|nr:peroxide stress protein YaaA [Bacteroidia bacterium]NNE15316.1 peroxide stress protein YaaA [Saprospiraceae bacterium]NNL93960.1 peroxide stress protein YaaA [Saprospiraceae bacterium]
MLALLSPAKTLDYSPTETEAVDLPKLRKDSLELIKILKTKSAQDLMKLMHITDNLANLNFDRYQTFSSRYTDKNSKASLLAFKGDVYLGLEADTLNQKEIAYAQDHIKILSGLYGILNPLDKMQPYRLEMGTKLKNERGSNLYKFWGNKITKEINKAISKHKHSAIINLASQEYFKVIDRKSIKAPILDINFREYKNGELKFISYTAKKARGLMARYIVKEEITNLEKLKGFNYENYTFEESLSDDNQYTFVR